MSKDSAMLFKQALKGIDFSLSDSSWDLHNSCTLSNYSKKEVWLVTNFQMPLFFFVLKKKCSMCLEVKVQVKTPASHAKRI